ncbi:MAG: sugar phosphate isomerase/epimerase [Clostridia bacterium]|nr:sugar phosphate isomerase/epimerase [Clostridia bacterium]
MEIGAQFYTLRDHCSNLEDFALSLKKVADIGYRFVQISGVCEYSPEWLDAELKKNGLKCVLTHYGADEIKNHPDEVAKRHAMFGCKYIGLGCMPNGIVTEESTRTFINEYKPSAQILKENGAQLFYHNHDMEFQKTADGKWILEKIVEGFEPSELQFTLDTYWVQHGGADVCDVIDMLAGRLKCVHLKDFLMVNGEQRMAPVGRGSLNFPKILKHLEDAGCEYALVEQDHTYGEDPFECLKESYEYLRGIIK